MAVGQVHVKVLDDADDAGGLGSRAVGRHRHEVDLDRQVDRPRDVADEVHRTLEDADDQWWIVRVVGGDLRPELSHALLDLLSGEDNVSKLCRCPRVPVDLHASSPHRDERTCDGSLCTKAPSGPRHAHRASDLRRPNLAPYDRHHAFNLGGRGRVGDCAARTNLGQPSPDRPRGQGRWCRAECHAVRGIGKGHLGQRLEEVIVGAGVI